jgi:hypothetical protein
MEVFSVRCDLMQVEASLSHRSEAEMTCRGRDIEGRQALGKLASLFIDHPRSLHMGWAEHAFGAVKTGVQLIGAGLACFIHALVPGWFTHAAGRTVTAIHADMMQSKAEAADRDERPEHGI